MFPWGTWAFPWGYITKLKKKKLELKTNLKGNGLEVWVFWR